MALPISVEKMLRQRKVESNKIEFKKDGCCNLWPILDAWHPFGYYN